MTTATTTATKISVSHLYKRYGSHQVIDDVSFDVQEGQVTLLAGPNGAGKSTLLRMICGLDTIDKGDITIMGRHYSQLSDPKHTIGALLDATWLDTALTAEQNLRVLADLAGIHRRRVANCLEMCGLTSVAGRKVSDFSLGMRQRCGIAAALLGDPDLLILDEPVNGLDPAGMRWLNDLLESHTQAGGTTLLSSHFVADSELIASRVVILGKGKTLWEGSLAELTGGARHTVFASYANDLIASQLHAMYTGLEITPLADGKVQVNVPPEDVSIAARIAEVDLTHLTVSRITLAEAFEQISEGQVEFQ